MAGMMFVGVMLLTPFQVPDDIALICGPVLFTLAVILSIVAWRTEKLLNVFVETAIQDADEFIRHFSKEEKSSTANDALLAAKIKFIADAQREFFDEKIGVYQAIGTQPYAFMIFMSLYLFLSNMGKIMRVGESSTWYSPAWNLGFSLFFIFFFAALSIFSLVKWLQARHMFKLIESTAIQNADELLAYLEEKEKCLNA